MKARVPPLAMALALALAATLPRGAGAFTFEPEVFVGAGAGHSLNPSRRYLVLGPDPSAMPAVVYRHTQDNDLASTLRLGARGELAGPLGYEFNALASALYSSALEDRALLSVPVTGRSLLFQRAWDGGPDRRYRLELDQALLRLEMGRLSIKAGRQPINLATNFYYAPNDLFSPFLPQEFFRIYKPGVDALRVSLGLTHFSLVEVIGVLGYEAVADDGAVNRHDLSLGGPWGNGALLARARAGFSHVEATLFAGRAPGANLVGGSLQADFGGDFQVSGECNTALPEEWFPGAGTGMDASAGVSWQFTPNASGRVEYGFLGRFPAQAPTGLEPRHVLAVGAGGQLSALWNAALLYQFAKGNDMASGNLVYSLGDNTDLALTVNVVLEQQTQDNPLPLPAAGAGLFDLVPSASFVEIRHFF